MHCADLIGGKWMHCADRMEEWQVMGLVVIVSSRCVRVWCLFWVFLSSLGRDCPLSRLIGVTVVIQKRIITHAPRLIRAPGGTL